MGPHQYALSPKEIAHFETEAAEKVKTNQKRLVLWDDIKDNPPQGTEDLPYCSHSAQVKGFLVDPIFVVLPTAQKWRGPCIRKRHYGKNGTSRCH